MGRSVEAGGEGAREIIGGIEPTGIVAETKARQETWEAARAKIEQLELQGVKPAIEEWRAAVQELSARIAALPTEEVSAAGKDIALAAAAIRRQVEEARLADAVNALEETTLSLQRKIELLDVAAINDLTADLRVGAAEMTRLGQNISVDMALLSESAQKRIDVVSAENLRSAVERLTAAVENIDLAAARLPSTADKLDSTLGAVRTGFVTTSAAGMLGMVCMGLWLFRWFRPRL